MGKYRVELAGADDAFVQRASKAMAIHPNLFLRRMVTAARISYERARTPLAVRRSPSGQPATKAGE